MIMTERKKSKAMEYKGYSISLLRQYLQPVEWSIDEAGRPVDYIDEYDMGYYQYEYDQYLVCGEDMMRYYINSDEYDFDDIIEAIDNNRLTDITV